MLEKYNFTKQLLTVAKAKTDDERYEIAIVRDSIFSDKFNGSFFIINIENNLTQRMGFIFKNSLTSTEMSLIEGILDQRIISMDEITDTCGYFRIHSFEKELFSLEKLKELKNKTKNSNLKITFKK